MQSLFLAVAVGLVAAEAPDVVVVYPPSFQAALRPWFEYRTQQGHRLGYLSSQHTTTDIRAAIRETAKTGKLKYLVLVGDAEPAAVRDATIQARHLPTHHIAAKVNVKWGSEPEIAADNWYADLDDDGVPELAVGRLPADTPEELSVMIQKILAYERAKGTWQQRVNFVAGVGGFGPVVDTVLETAVKKFLTDGIPSSYSSTMTYGSWHSPFCPNPTKFHDAALARLKEGSLFWVYIGHGAPQQLDRVYVPGGAYRILDTNDMPKLRDATPTIGVFLACYTAAFDLPRDCLGEQLVKTPGGPVAVLGGSRVTMPYGMSVLGTAMMDECFKKRRETLGEILLHGKQRLAHDEPDNLNRQMLDVIATTISPAPDMLAEERLEHVSLMNLLGDPLLRIHHPHEIELAELHDVTAGESLDICGRCDISGRCTVELVRRLGYFKQDFPARPEFVATPASLQQFNDDYHQANDRTWTQQSFMHRHTTGEFRTRLEVPSDAHGPCHVRVLVEGQERQALGATNVFIRRATVDQATARERPSKPVVPR